MKFIAFALVFFAQAADSYPGAGLQDLYERWFEAGRSEMVLMPDADRITCFECLDWDLYEVRSISFARALGMEQVVCTKTNSNKPGVQPTYFCTADQAPTSCPGVACPNIGPTYTVWKRAQSR